MAVEYASVLTVGLVPAVNVLWVTAARVPLPSATFVAVKFSLSANAATSAAGSPPVAPFSNVIFSNSVVPS